MKLRKQLDDLLAQNPRTEQFHGWIKKENKDFIEDIAKKRKKTMSEILDHIIDIIREEK